MLSDCRKLLLRSPRPTVATRQGLPARLLALLCAWLVLGGGSWLPWRGPWRPWRGLGWLWRGLWRPAAEEAAEVCTGLRGRGDPGSEEPPKDADACVHMRAYRCACMHAYGCAQSCAHECTCMRVCECACACARMCVCAWCVWGG